MVLTAAWPQPSLAADAACPQVALLGAGGSGQAPGLGPQIGDLFDELEPELARAGRTTSVVALDYPAVDLVRSFGFAFFNGNYDRAVDVGARRLAEEVAGLASDCPDAVMVLAGYSQGSHVIKRSLRELQPTVAIGAVVLLADPTRDPDQPEVLRLGVGAGTRGGILGSLSVPRRFRAGTIDVCASGDSVCSRGWPRPGTHVWGYEDLTSAVADVVASRTVPPALPSWPIVLRGSTFRPI